MRKRLGEILIERGLLDLDQLTTALAHQRQWGMRLGTAMVAKGFIAEGTLTRVLAEHLNVPMVDLAKVTIDPRVVALVPRRLCEEHEVLPVSVVEAKDGKGRRTLVVATADPLNATVLDEIGFASDCHIKPVIAQISSLEQAIARYLNNQRVHINPLNFDDKKLGTGSTMTITQKGVERIIDTDPAYAGQPTGSFVVSDVAPPTARAEMPTLSQEGQPINEQDIIGVSRAADVEALEALEKKFWALMRVLAQRGLVTKEEFLRELRIIDDSSGRTPQ
jgi:Type II secretion system (T2SS), protein E, N-terminal domain